VQRAQATQIDIACPGVQLRSGRSYAMHCRYLNGTIVQTEDVTKTTDKKVHA